MWVEELDEIYSDWSGVYKKELGELIAEKDEMVYEIRYLDGLREDYGIEIYEWIKHDTPLHKMSVEICNLRGLDLTDDNIRLIVEEFSK